MGPSYEGVAEAGRGRPGASERTYKVSLIRLNDVSKQYDGKQVLRQVYFRLDQGDRVGLIGKNGTGKTTILRLILGREEPSQGQVELDAGLRIGYFSQFSELSGQAAIGQILEEVFADARATEKALRQVEQAMGAEPDEAELQALLARYQTLSGRMEQLDGWTYQNRIETALSKLSFNEDHRRLPVDQLSGGWRNRAALAQILLQAPDVLLLDEPTNFLDFEGLAWLEQWLAKFRGAVVLVSHDRHFLGRVVNRVVEIENYHFQEYPGDFAQYINLKRARVKSLERQFKHEEELLAFEREAIEDRRQAARNPSDALQRRLANIGKQVEPRPVDQIATELYAGLRPGKRLCQIEELSKQYGDRLLFFDLSGEISPGQRLAVIGPNGSGKSTLLEVLTQQIPPDTGRVIWPQGTPYVYFNQVFADLDPNDTLSHAINTAPLAFYHPRRLVHRFLAMMQFSEMDLQQRIGTLSGGQQARVALALCLLSGASAIILDEPTNHLDMTSTQVMERALLHFPGAVVVVSHDRFFIDKVATRLLIFDGEGETRLFEGNWTMWQAAGAGTVA